LQAPARRRQLEAKPRRVGVRDLLAVELAARRRAGDRRRARTEPQAGARREIAVEPEIENAHPLAVAVERQALARHARILRPVDARAREAVAAVEATARREMRLASDFAGAARPRSPALALA